MNFKDAPFHASKRLHFIVVGLIAFVVGIAIFFPAHWIAWVVERQSNGQIVLADAQGNIWRGEAGIMLAEDAKSPAKALFPGRFAWKISPLILLGKIQIEIANSAVIQKPITIAGTFKQLELSEAKINIPSDRLQSIGAPLNTIAPEGRIELEWQTIAIYSLDGVWRVRGETWVNLMQISSRLSPIKPLGDYRLQMQWQDQNVHLVLYTSSGALILGGQGDFKQGHLRFRGEAKAAQGFDDKLASLLNLLGQRRKVGDQFVTALEFNS